MPGWFKKSGSRPSSSSEDDGEESTRESAQALRQGLEDHLKARADLLGLEAREAGEIIARKGVLGVAIAGLVFFAYALLLVASVSLLGRWLENSWPDPFGGIGWQLAAISLGVLHFLIALRLFTRLKRKPGLPLFEYTRAEFQKDREWLQQNKNQSGSANDSSL